MGQKCISILILGLVTAAVISAGINQTTEAPSTVLSISTSQPNNITTTTAPSRPTVNMTTIQSITSHPGTKAVTPKPIESVSTNSPIITTKKVELASTGSATTGIVVLVIIVFAVIIIGAACFFTQKKSQGYSVDLQTSPDEAQIPLSLMNPAAPTEDISHNGTQVFVGVENDTKETKDAAPVAEAKTQVEQKAEPEASVGGDGVSEPAGPAESPEGSKDKVKDATVEPDAPSHAKEGLEKKTGEKEAVSDKTSEAPKDQNVNNSNSVVKTGTSGNEWKPNSFSEVPLDSPV